MTIREEYALCEEAPQSNGCIELAKASCLCCIVAAIAGTVSISCGIVYVKYVKNNVGAQVNSDRYK